MMTSPGVLFSVILVLSFACAFWHYRSAPRQPFSAKIVTPLLFPLAVCLTGLFILKVEWSLYNEHNWDRLQNTFALARGFPVYHARNSGTVLNSIYGPVSFFLYLPSTLASTPSGAMRIAELILMGCFFLPPLWFFLTPAPEEEKSPEKNFHFRLFVFFIFCFFPFITKPLRDAAFNIHVDGPTLGLAALSCGFLYFRTPKSREVSLSLSALLAILAVWSKQVAVPLLAALPIYLWIADGWKTALRLGLYLLGYGIAVSALILLAFHPDPIIFNIFVIPSQHGLQENSAWALAASFFKLIGESATVLIWAAVSLIPLFLKMRPSSLWDAVRSWRGSLFLIAGVLMIPTSILGNAKLGGSTNTFSYACYFFLIAAAVGFLKQSSQRGLRLFLAGLAVFFLCLEIPWIYSRGSLLAKQVNHAETAFAYAKKHPGEAYFPQLNVVTLMAENENYHSSTALRDLDWADFPVTQEHFRAHLPKKMNLFAFQKKTANDRDILHRYLPDYVFLKENDPELPGFLVFRNKQSS